MHKLAAAALPLAALAACGAAEETARNSFRETSISSCVAGSRQAAPAGMAGFDWQRLCSCATDRIMEGKSTAELAQMRPGDPGQREAIQQCVADMIRDGAAPAAPKQG